MAYKDQPRQYFDPKKQEEMVESIRLNGQLVSGIVRRLDACDDKCQYELVAGERRFRACIILGIKFRAEVVDEVDPKNQFIMSLTENIIRQDMSPVEIYKALQRIQKENDFTFEQLAARIGKSTTYVSQYMSLAYLKPEVLDMMSPTLPKRLSISDAVFLAKINDKETQLATAKLMLSNRIDTRRSGQSGFRIKPGRTGQGPVRSGIGLLTGVITLKVRCHKLLRTGVNIEDFRLLGEIEDNIKQLIEALNQVQLRLNK
jgi:ParB family chromosome partitioning protein